MSLVSRNGINAVDTPLRARDSNDMREPFAALILGVFATIATAAEPTVLARLGDDRFRQANYVADITYSPDGKQLVTADGDSIHYWDAATGNRLHTTQTDKHAVAAIRFHPSGRVLYAAAAGDRETYLYLIDSASRKVLSKRRVLDYKARCTFSADGAYLGVYAWCGNSVRILNTANQATVTCEWSDREECNGLAFRGDGKAAAVTTNSGRVRLLDTGKGTVIKDLLIGREVRRIVFTPDGGDLIAHAKGSELIRIDGTNVEIVWSRKALRFEYPLFLDAGKQLLFWGFGHDGDPRFVWHTLDASTGKSVSPPMEAELGPIALRPDGKVIAIGGLGGGFKSAGLISQRDLATRRRIEIGSANPATEVHDLRFSADGRQLRGFANGWYEWDVATRKQVRLSAPLDPRWDWLAAASPDRKWLARADIVHQPEPYRLQLIDLSTGRVRLTSLDRKPCYSLRFLSDGRLLIGNEGGLTELIPESGRQELRVEVSAHPGELAASEDGKLAVATSWRDGQLHVRRWDLVTGQSMPKWSWKCRDPNISGAGHIEHTQVSSDGRLLIVCVSDGRSEEAHTLVFDTISETPLGQWSNIKPWAGLTLSPDGHSAVCWFDEDAPVGGCEVRGRPEMGPEVEIRELATGSIRRHYLRSMPVTGCAISPNGRVLAVATNPGPVELWDLLTDGTSLGTKLQVLKPATIWDGLSSQDGEKAFTTVLQMRTNPAESVACLRNQLKSLKTPNDDWVNERIRGLEAPEFRERETATAELAAAGELILPRLRAALLRAQPESRGRLSRLIAKAEALPIKLGALRAREVLRAIDSPESNALAADWHISIPQAARNRESTPIFLNVTPREK